MKKKSYYIHTISLIKIVSIEHNLNIDTEIVTSFHIFSFVYTISV